MQQRITFSPDNAEFRKNFEAGKSQLVWSWVSSDLETPVSAYLKICGHRPHSFLLESVEGGKTLGRYSVIGTSPDLLWRCTRDKVEIKYEDALWTEQNASPKESLKEIISQSALDVVPDGLPPMCAFGMFGYLGYDMVRLVEDIPDENPDELGVPDSVLMRPTLLVIFDNVKNKLCIATPIYEHANNSELPADVVFNKATARLAMAQQYLNRPIDHEMLNHETRLKGEQEAVSNMPEKDYKDAVSKAVEYIKAGEIFQVVPSQRFSIDFDLPSIELYRELRSVNPSPFLFHLSFDGFSLIGSSPEILVRLRENTVTIRPIAGTRKRGANDAEDKALKEELLGDPKERAEHLMLLDLGRNDIGRVAEIGSVKVTEEFQVEMYSHVMHIISNVEGTLKKDCDVLDALFSGFPAGTVSGAPKIRAMEIIDELEVSRRGVYAGGIGYFSKNTMDSCIALRTAVLKDKKLYVQAGGGVVADSDPDFEHNECCNKAKALIHAANNTLKKYQ